MHEDILASFKKKTQEDAIQSRITIFDELHKRVGYLLPLGGWVLENIKLIEQVASWRNKFNRMFPSQFVATIDSTKLHLKNIIEAKDAIIFFIEDLEGKIIGHIGAINVTETNFELAHLMRGEQTSNTEIMLCAEKHLIEWGLRELKINSIKLEVMSYNFSAISLHEKIGFKFVKKMPIKKIKVDNGVRHEICKVEDANVNYEIVEYEFYKIKL